MIFLSRVPELLHDIKFHSDLLVTYIVTCIVTSQHIQVTIFIPLFMRHDEDLVKYGGLANA